MGFDAAVTERPSGQRCVEGVVVELLPAQQFRVELTGGEKVAAHLAPGRSRGFVRLRLRDRVKVELTAGDPARGRIVEVLNRGL